MGSTLSTEAGDEVFYDALDGVPGAEGVAGCGVAPHAARPLERLVPLLLSHLGARDGPLRALRLVNAAACAAVDHSTLRLTVQGGRSLRGLVAAAPRFRALRELVLVASGAACLRALADAAPALGATLPRLASITITPHACAGPFDDAAPAATALASKLCALPGLRRLAVRLANLPPAACDVLISGAACLPALESFGLASPAGWDGSDALRAALKRPATWARLQELSLSGLNARALEALASAPQLAALSSLTLSACGAHAGTVSAAQRRRLAAALGAVGREDEEEDTDEDEDEGEDEGAHGGGSSSESEVEGEDEEGDDEVWYLASAPWYGQLRALSLESCGLRDLGPLPEGLESLSLAYNRLCDGAAALLASMPLPRLRRLDLSGNADISSRGAAALARAPWLCSGGGPVAAACGRAAGTSGSSSGSGSGSDSDGSSGHGERLEPPGLWSLRLGGTRVGDEGAAALAATLALRSGLRALSLPSSIITDTAVAALAVACPCALVELDFTGAPPGSPAPPRNPRLGRGRAAWRKLSAAPLWALRRLDLRGAGLSPAAALELGAAPWLPRLEALLLPEFLDEDVMEVLRYCPGYLHLERAGRVSFEHGGDAGGAARRHAARRDAAADGVGLFEEAMGAAAVAAAATMAVAMAFSAGGRR